MARYIIKRIIQLIPVIFGVMVLVFLINRMSPIDPAIAILGADATPEQLAEKRAELGLDQPIIVQFGNYVYNAVFKLDLGNSYQNGQPCMGLILERLPITLALGVISTILAVVIGVPLGILSATRQYSAVDSVTTVTSLIFASIPNYWLSLILIILFALNLRWFPVTGFDSWEGWILPSIAMAMWPVATVCRTTRSSMLEVIRQDYICTAKAKGLDQRTIIYKHALKNSLIPIIVVVGMQLGMIVAGSLTVENIFSVPGIGNLLITAINNKDYNLVQATVLVIGVSICVMNFIVDIIYSFVDPRIKAEYKASSAKKQRVKTVKTSEKKEEC